MRNKIDRVGGAARKAGSAVGSYALGGKHSSRRAGLKAAGAQLSKRWQRNQDMTKDAKDGAQIIGMVLQLVAFSVSEPVPPQLEALAARNQDAS